MEVLHRHLFHLFLITRRLPHTSVGKEGKEKGSDESEGGREASEQTEPDEPRVLGSDATLVTIP